MNMKEKGAGLHFCGAAAVSSYLNEGAVPPPAHTPVLCLADRLLCVVAFNVTSCLCLQKFFGDEYYGEEEEEKPQFEEEEELEGKLIEKASFNQFEANVCCARLRVAASREQKLDVLVCNRALELGYLDRRGA